MSSLQDLLEECRVFVKGVTQGSGFFVAPGFVVSCAHVAGADPEEAVEIRWRDTGYEAVVCAAAPRGGAESALWPFPDLAVLEIVHPPDSHPCVWLDSSLPDVDTTLTAVGFSDTLDSTGARRASLTSGGRSSLQQHPVLEIVGGEVNLGLSGGPVLSHVSGGVCAIVKATREQDSIMGGFGTPVDALRLLDPRVYGRLIRAHDRFHLSDERWHRLSDRIEDDYARLPSGCLSRAEDREFLGLLARLDRQDAPAVHTAAFSAAAPLGTQLPDRPLVTHRDVYAALAALMLPEAGTLPYQLAYCADLARNAVAADDRAGVLRELRDYVLIVAGRLDLGPAARRRTADDRAATSTPSVLGMVRHSLRDRSLYHVMVWRYRSRQDIVPAAEESPGLPLREGLGYLRRLLAEQIDVLGGMSRPGLVELILPVELLDEDFAEWALWPASPYSTLGRKQQVVVRPLERHERLDAHHAWERRWRQLQDKPVGEALVCVCGRGRQQQARLDAAFNNDLTLAAVALAGSPRSGPVAQAYEVAVASGVPVMLWLRGAAASPLSGGHICGIPGRDAVRCRTFPFVILTSNGEREFPPAFLRRCVRLQLPPVTQDDERLRAIVQAHLPDAGGHADQVISRFMEHAATGELATDQLLNAVYLFSRTSTEGAPDFDRLVQLVFQHLNVPLSAEP